MHTIMNTIKTNSRTNASARRKSATRKPHYDCKEQDGVLVLSIYVPGVEESGVRIENHGPDLAVIALKPHLVRVNWRALHLETAQRDYLLRLRLGNNLDYTAMTASLSDGILSISIPKKTAVVPVPALAVA